MEDDAAVRAALAGEPGAQRLRGEAGRRRCRGAHELDTTPFDVVVTDAIMPGGMNGLELVEWLRIVQPGLPVVLMTGYSDEAFGGELPAGVDLLRKPFTAAALLDLLGSASCSRCCWRDRGPVLVPAR